MSLTISPGGPDRRWMDTHAPDYLKSRHPVAAAAPLRDRFLPGPP
ncbi:hypothetical protein SXCC_01533 [Gluconacetobacter sp. SXCC-1]|nr:hypothetical protein SXCC_01533 [Gluconacetobacter sp. SXCC-1]